MFSKIVRGVVSAALLGVLGGCAALDQDARIKFLEGQMKDVLEKSAAWDVTSRGVRQQTADTAAEIATIREQVQSLTGRVEDMLSGGVPRENPIFAQAGLGAEVRDLQERIQYLEARLSELERRVSGEAPGEGAGALEPSATRSASEPPSKAATQPPATGPRQEYDRAMDALKQKKYTTAIKLFRDFVRKYPGDSLADNAQYWIGEARWARHDYRGALAAFRETVNRFPQGNKVPDALLKAGQCLEQLGDLAGARDSYLEVRRRFPESATALIAAERLASL